MLRPAGRIGFMNAQCSRNIAKAKVSFTKEVFQVNGVHVAIVAQLTTKVKPLYGATG